jgi:hypothetical protein
MPKGICPTEVMISRRIKMMTCNAFKSGLKLAVVAGLAFVCCITATLMTWAQNPTVAYCPDGTRVRYGDPCPSSSRSTGTASTNSASSAAEMEAETARKRMEELQRQQEEQRRLEEEKKRKEQEKRKSDVADAAAHLKGVSPDNMQLKGENSASLGLKGVSSGDASTQIHLRSPGEPTGDVSTAWQQLHCSAEIMGYAVADVQKIASGEADARELDEVKYLANEASNALHGNAPRVACSTAPSINFARAPDPAKLASVYEGLITRTVNDAQNIVAARQKAQELQQQLGDLKAKAKTPTGSQTETVQKSPAASQAPSQTGQNANLTADQQHINEVYQQQKKNEQKKSDDLALLRAIQAHLNEVNSRMIASAADADKVQQETKKLLNGELPDSSNHQ